MMIFSSSVFALSPTFPRARLPVTLRSVRLLRMRLKVFLRQRRKRLTVKRSLRHGGGEVDGEEGRIGAPRESRQDLWKLTNMLLGLGWANQFVLQALLGLYAATWAFKKECFAVFHGIYKYVDAHPLAGAGYLMRSETNYTLLRCICQWLWPIC